MAAKQQSKELNLFEQGQKLIEKGQKLLVQGLENARKEQAAIEEITKTLSVVHFSSTVKLNVGGRIYKTTLDTLRKDPDSMLSAMFSGRFELKADEEDGAYFIDRDGELFRIAELIVQKIEFEKVVRGNPSDSQV
ncbi:BTB/POZ domain-containing protein KCTD15-like [Stylophora pistillata]|uniref:BTB/POZ domain-containing protein KCTD15-like n=1 Tax=Stylophora pistillata TaxID=50429 RepID=UPI000C044E11|nr:BTB/POZ domain-containing protein KCTD15-like [Stylophora pistillata]